MADKHNAEVRSYNMSQIRGKDTKPELLVRKFLFGLGLRYKLYDKRLPGKPDLVFPKFKTVVFVHGCFWTVIKIVNILQFRKPEPNGGQKRSFQIRNATN
jgi:DNA mismatch endonuclease Vsr